MKDEQNELNEPQAQYAPKVQKEIETEQELIKEQTVLLSKNATSLVCLSLCPFHRRFLISLARVRTILPTKIQ